MRTPVFWPVIIPSPSCTPNFEQYSTELPSSPLDKWRYLSYLLARARRGNRQPIIQVFWLLLQSSWIKPRLKAVAAVATGEKKAVLDRDPSNHQSTQSETPANISINDHNTASKRDKSRSDDAIRLETFQIHKSTIMKKTSLTMNRDFFALFFLISSATLVLLSGCKKTDFIRNNVHHASSYTSDVLDKWMTMQLRLMTNATGIPNQAFSRHFAYAGITAFESIAPGVPTHNTWSKKWNGLTGLPNDGDQAKKYYYPANVNAAMASINRSLFPNASNADKVAIDSLENALTQEFLATKSASLIQASASFGKEVAVAVFNWSETDGSKLAGNPYTPPTGAGLWVPTAPGFANAGSPYWGNNRPLIKGSIENTDIPAPIEYSAEVGSPFYNMVKEVYDASQNLTDAQKAMAVFWRDVPGVTSPGHWLSILRQALRQTDASLDKAALSYAVTGSAINDALITCWKSKYKYNLVRPITYIRNVLGQPTWTSHLTTPAHPEYPSAHAVLSIAAGEAMQKLLGNVGSFTDHTYEYLGFAPRTYASFIAVGEEAGVSRFYAGIHYQASIEIGFVQGKKVATNIFSTGKE